MRANLILSLASAFFKSYFRSSRRKPSVSFFTNPKAMLVINVALFVIPLVLLQATIGTFPIPANVESILVTLCNMKGMIKSRKQGPDVSCGFRRKVDKKKRVQVVRIDLYRNPQEIDIKLGALDLQEWFRVAVPNTPVGKDHKFKLDVNNPEASEVVGKIFQKLKEISQTGA